MTNSKLTRDRLDTMLEVTNAYADEGLGMTGIDALRAALNDYCVLTDLHYELYGRDLETADEGPFRGIVALLITHAGTADDDLYND